MELKIMTSNAPLFHSPDGVSVVIPCAGRVELLGALLVSLQEARAVFPYPVEVLLLDNSTSADRQQIAKLATTNNATFISGSSNISEKRNQGARSASYELILFLDSDCTVDSQILLEHFNAFKSGQIAGCLGNLIFTGPDTSTWKSVERTGVLECFSIPDGLQSVQWGPTANISFRRDVFLAVGGFDPSFSRPGGEDVDLGFRLQKSEFSIHCNPKAIAFHTKETWATFGQVFERFLRYGSADALLIKKHPDHSLYDFPMVSQYLVLLLLFSLLWWPLQGIVNIFLPVIWILLSIGIHTVMGLLYERDSQATWRVHAEQLILLTGLDFGRLIGAVRHRQFSAVYRRIIFFEDQLSVDWSGVTRSSLAFLLALFFTLLINSILVSI
jgi:GT2 family glycosyltransferase